MRNAHLQLAAAVVINEGEKCDFTLLTEFDGECDVVGVFPCHVQILVKKLHKINQVQDKL